MERRFIQDVPLEQRPRLNWKLNEDNPRHVPKWTQIEQRHARDDRQNRPRWESTPYRPEAYGYRPAPKVRRPLPVFVWWLAAWLGMSVAGWIGAVWRWDFSAWWHPAALSGALATALLLWAWLGFPVTRRQRRRARRKLRWWR
jgi:hypothetical protein